MHNTLRRTAFWALPGRFTPRSWQRFDIDLPVLLLDLDLENVFRAAGTFSGFRPLSRFPDVYRDSAFLLDEEIPRPAGFGGGSIRPGQGKLKISFCSIFTAGRVFRREKRVWESGFDIAARKKL